MVGLFPLCGGYGGGGGILVECTPSGIPCDKMARFVFVLGVLTPCMTTGKETFQPVRCIQAYRWSDQDRVFRLCDNIILN